VSAVIASENETMQACKKALMTHRLHVPILKPEAVIPHLAKPELHWKFGYSAQELALAWSKSAKGFPPAVRSVLSTVPE